MVDTIKMFAWDPPINPNKVRCFIIHTYALKVIFDYHTKYITTYVNDSFIEFDAIYWILDYVHGGLTLKEKVVFFTQKVMVCVM